MHFVMYAFSNHVGVLHNVTPIDLLVQSAVLSDGVVFCVPTIQFMGTKTQVAQAVLFVQNGTFGRAC